MQRMIGTSFGSRGPNRVLTVSTLSVGFAVNGSLPSQTLTLSWDVLANSIMSVVELDMMGSPYLI
jgi:hypothetical protein